MNRLNNKDVEAEEEEAAAAAATTATTAAAARTAAEDEEKEEEERTAYAEKMKSYDLPTSFGRDISEEKSQREHKANSQISKCRRPESEVLAHILPVTHEAVLRGHTKMVSALAANPSGARLITGSHDYMIKLWDFGAMDPRLQSFREAQPSEGCPVNGIAYSPDVGEGSIFAVATGSAQPKLYGKDAHLIYEFAKGDRFLLDMANTKGHVQEVTSIAWNPRDRDVLLTASLDGTVRLWNPATLKVKQASVIKVPNRVPRQRAAVTAAAWDREGRMFAAGVKLDGSIYLWRHGGYCRVPSIELRGAHTPNPEITSLCFSGDGNSLLSRARDDTLKLWDLRRPGKAVAVWDEMPLCGEHTDCLFSPDGRYVVTGADSSVLCIDAKTREFVGTTDFDAGVTRILWHERLNQMFVGLADGTVRVMFDPAKSSNGALLCMSRAVARTDDVVADVKPQYITPMETDDLLHIEMPIHKQLRIMEQERREKMRGQNFKAARPRMGVDGTLGSNLTHHQLLSTGLVVPEIEDDPVETLRRYGNPPPQKQQKRDDK